MAIAFGVLGLLSRAALELEGTVTFSETTCEGPTGHRCSTLDLIESQLTGRTERYRASNNDQAIARRLPVGTRIHKVKWSLAYEIDGAPVDDFPRRFYYGTSAVGLALWLTGLLRFLWLRQWRSLARAIRGDDTT